MERVRLTDKEIQDIVWYTATFQKRPSLKKAKSKDPLFYLFPKVSYCEIGAVFGKSPKTIETLLKRI